jgi:menaquinone-specific isochorismate synthase
MSSAAQRAPFDAPERNALEAELSAALSRSRDAASITLVSLPAPVAPSEMLLAGTNDDAVAWAAPGRFELAALGEVASLSGEGPGRFEAVERGATELLARVETASVGGAELLPARLFGGFSFTGEAPRSEIWAPFGGGRFVLPSLGYVRENERATLFLCLRAAELDTAAARDRVMERAFAALATLEAQRELGAPKPTSAAAVRERPAEEWNALVEAIRRQIEHGSLEKVVLARRLSVELSEPCDPALVLARLRDQAQACTRFLLRRAGSSFLGATPERLAQKQGLTLETEAVAGTMSADREGAQRLLESAKDSAEHAFVVREIVRALTPISSALEHADRPDLHQLRHVVHLRTKVTAKLREPRHLLDLVSRLHPTPAVGGVPVQPALAWIARHEPDERGWYAGPFGWFDGRGDGEMAVALRSGVLAGTTAHLYAGSGIVARSNPSAEFTETRWKLAALLSALGVA